MLEERTLGELLQCPPLSPGDVMRDITHRTLSWRKSIHFSPPTPLASWPTTPQERSEVVVEHSSKKCVLRHLCLGSLAPKWI